MLPDNSPFPALQSSEGSSLVLIPLCRLLACSSYGCICIICILHSDSMPGIQIEMGAWIDLHPNEQWLYLFIWSPFKQAAACWKAACVSGSFLGAQEPLLVPQDPFPLVYNWLELMVSAPAAFVSDLLSPCGGNYLDQRMVSSCLN